MEVTIAILKALDNQTKKNQYMSKIRVAVSEATDMELDRAIAGCYLNDDKILAVRQEYVLAWSQTIDQDIQREAMKEKLRRDSL